MHGYLCAKINDSSKFLDYSHEKEKSCKQKNPLESRNALLKQRRFDLSILAKFFPSLTIVGFLCSQLANCNSNNEREWECLVTVKWVVKYGMICYIGCESNCQPSIFKTKKNVSTKKIYNSKKSSDQPTTPKLTNHIDKSTQRNLFIFWHLVRFFFVVDIKSCCSLAIDIFSYFHPKVIAFL